ncbi:hypothetical protein HKCCSP123_04965 [Rhodobacterales bacterium HKCCSP123]|nr:hypothetical protein [Rhodobacterales bacterium HKCCSP123]
MIQTALPLACCLSLAPIAGASEVLQGDWPMGEIDAPSGQPLTLHGLLVEENPWSGELQVVVRLLAPSIAGDRLTNSELREDMDWACRTWGVPVAETRSMTPDWVIVEMMEAPVERGVTAPGVRRYFESYRLEGPICIWELF